MSDVTEKTGADARFEMYLNPILGKTYGFALHMARHREEAEDLVQEAVFRAFRSFGAFQDGTNFKAWLFKILTNVYLEKRRRTQGEPERVSLEETSDPDDFLYERTRHAGSRFRRSDAADRFFDRLDEEAIGAAMESLPEEYRIVASLYFMGDFSYEEIAEMTECPVGTVRSRLHRGRKALQKTLWRIACERGIIADPT
jgi:RNA polymerase sigma-70 factor (ECF subfamily)